MMKYKDFVYLYSRAHQEACCRFANVLAEKFAAYIGCSREEVSFLLYLPDSTTNSNPDCEVGNIKEICKGYAFITMSLRLKDEKSAYGNITVDIGLQKFQDGFLSRIDDVFDTYLLSEEDNTKLNKFFDALFKLFTEDRRFGSIIQ